MPTKKNPPEQTVDQETGEILDPNKLASIYSEEFKTGTLVQKLARIMGFVGTIPKRGYNAFHKYNYVMEADLVAAIRPYLAAAGIMIFPDVTEESREGTLTKVMVRYTVTDGLEERSFSIPGYGDDKGDKGVYKAMTGSMKYALMKLFEVETGDDPEMDTRVDERAASSEPRREVKITTNKQEGVKRGGHTELANQTQVQRIARLVGELKWTKEDLKDAMEGLLAKELTVAEGDAGKADLARAIKNLTTEEAGKLIAYMENVVEVEDNTLGGY